MVVQKKVPKRAPKVKKPKAKVEPKVEVKEEYSVEARHAKLAAMEIEAIEEPKTTLEAVQRMSDKRAQLCGQLMNKIEFGPRAQGVDELKEDIASLNVQIEELKLEKVLGDAKGR